MITKTFAFFKLGKTSALVLVLLLLNLNCSTNKSSQNSHNETQYLKMIEAGYQEAIVIEPTEDSGCGLLLELKETGQKLIPLKLESEFSMPGTVVWITFNYSRRHQGNCLIGVPITLKEILIRK